MPGCTGHCSYGFDVDFPLSSSVILVIAVALWIVWVAPYLLRNGRHLVQPAGEHAPDASNLETATPQAGYVMKMAAQQERTMTSTHWTGSGSGSGKNVSDGGRWTQAPAPAFKIRYGRLALATAGLLLLLTGFVSAVLGIFGVGSFWLPVTTLLGAAASVFTLRWLAVRDRRRKVDAAFRAAMFAPAHPDRSAPSHSPLLAPDELREQADNPLFDAQAGAVNQNPAPKALTALELRQAALAEAATSTDAVVRATDVHAGQGASWVPVEVPKPTYVEAPKAVRAAPVPLDLPEAPKAVGKPSLKQTHPQAQVASRAGDADPKPPGKAQSALSNLDDVLQRRRA